MLSTCTGRTGPPSGWRPSTRAGLRAFAWDAQTRHQVMGSLGLDVDGVYSDHVGILMAAIAATRVRPDDGG